MGIHFEWSLSTVGLILVAALLPLYLLKSLSGPRRPPGPRSFYDLNPLGMFSLFVSGSDIIAGKIHQTFATWAKEYGAITHFRVLSLQFFVISDRDLVTQMFSHTSSKIYTTRGRNGMKYFIPKSLLGFTHTDAQWKRHRSLIVGAFTETFLKKYFSSIVEVGEKVSNELQASPVGAPGSQKDARVEGELVLENMYTYTKDAKSGRILVHDVVDLFNMVTYEVLANTVMGKEWMALMPSFGTKEESSAALATADFLSPLPEALWNIVPFKKKDIATTALLRIRGHCLDQISKIRSTSATGDSMMHFLVNHEEGLDDNEVVDELLSLVMAGHETTANTLSFCLASLAYHPEIQMKARNEVQQVLSSNGGRFTYETLKQLPYIWQVFREALRLFPTVPVNARDADVDTELGGYFIPKVQLPRVLMVYVAL
mmetsp:Transcript_28229/g.47746  ORF Transcript_28229/g.47746 Transcript_28229/m.47746 type:complete len:428 (+) Transcript_28229:110-1393(+)